MAFENEPPGDEFEYIGGPDHTIRVKGLGGQVVFRSDLHSDKPDPALLALYRNFPPPAAGDKSPEPDDPIS